MLIYHDNIMFMAIYIIILLAIPQLKLHLSFTRKSNKKPGRVYFFKAVPHRCHETSGKFVSYPYNKNLSN